MDAQTRRTLRAVVITLRELLEAKLPAEEAFACGFEWLGDACRAARGLPGRLEKLPKSRLRQRAEALLSGEVAVKGLRASPAIFRDAGALGWAYQDWNTDERERVFERLRRETGAKIEREALVPATQLYTEGYMAEFLVQNALGPLWSGMGHALPEGWPLAIAPAARGVAARSAGELSVLDPACGGGHLLLAAFEALEALHRHSAPEVDARERCAWILNEQLVGLDIDARAVAIAREVLWMRACELAPGLRREAIAGLETHLVALPDALGSLLREGPCAELLARGYDVVIANPPFLGSKYMDPALKRHLAAHYPHTKQDLFSAFLERCLELLAPGGVAATVSMKSWLYQAAFTRFRERVFREYSLLAFADLGPHGFDAELGLHFGVSVALTCFQARVPDEDHCALGVRAAGARSPEGKAELLARAIAEPGHPERFAFPQSRLGKLPEAPFCYWLPDKLLAALAGGPTLAGRVKQGLATTDNSRFLRFAWEVPPGSEERWVPCAKGGTYRKWCGLDYVRVDWQDDGAAIKALIPRKYPYLQSWEWVAKNAGYYFKPGLTYSYMCYGSLSARVMEGAIFEVASIGVFPEPQERAAVLATLNCRTSSWLLRALSQKHMFQAGMTERLPVPRLAAKSRERVEALVALACERKRELLSLEVLEGACEPGRFELRESLKASVAGLELEATAAVLHTAEGWLERLVCDGYGFTQGEREALAGETGRPAGWYPLVAGYDGAIAGMPDWLGAYVTGLPRRSPSGKELAALRARVRTLYEGGPREIEGAEEDGVWGAIPHETHLEAIAAQAGVHPVSAYWLLQEGRTAGWRCVAEQKRLAEELFSVLVLRLLGHRWPQEQPAGGGILPLMGEDGLVARVRQALPDVGIEAEFAEVVGESLEHWLQYTFFRRHVRQFKRRPVVWQIQSRPSRRGQGPAFACLVHYHALDRETPGRLRKLAEREGASRQAELEEFVARLEKLEREGFEGEGYDPELHDGVRVNIALWQRAGVLGAEVLAREDVGRAIADRAEWQLDLSPTSN